MSRQQNDEQMITDQAWARLQDKLAKEPRNPRWAELAQASAAGSLEAAGPQPELPQPGSSATEAEVFSSTAVAPAPSKQKSGFAQWIRKRRKLVGTASAAALLVIVISTAAGNEALAAILHKFRMQEMTVVQQEDLQMILNGAFNDNTTRESINKFGTFTQKSGAHRNDPLTAEDAKQLLNGKLLLPKQYDAKSDQIYAMPSNTITFEMNVDEVNNAMKRLGARKLLPASVNGKPITLELGQSIHISGRAEQSRYSLSQQPVPEITVDPSIPVTEAMAAVLEFPLLPENLKQAMQTTNMLNGGSVPLPVIANRKMEQIKIGGTTVLIKKSGTEQNPYYSAYWVQNGMLLDYGASGIGMTQDKLVAQVKELIGS